MPRRSPRKVRTRIVAAKNQSNGLQGWFLNQISLGNLAIIISFVITASIFYADTRSSFAVQTNAMAAINERLAKAEKDDDRKERAVIVERDKLRTEVTARAEKTADSLASINEKTAVFGAQLISIREELGKISAQVASLAATSAATTRK